MQNKLIMQPIIMGVIIMTKMMVSSIRQVLASTFLKVLLLFLLSVPVFYFIDVATSKGANDSIVYLNLGLRALRFLLVGALCWLTGRKNKGLFLQNPEQCKKILKVFAAAIVLCLIFHFNGFFTHLNGTVALMLGISRTGNHLFLTTVLWLQLFNGDLLWSVLLCFPLLFAGNLSKKQA